VKALDPTEVGTSRFGAQDRNGDVEGCWPVQGIRVGDKMEGLEKVTGQFPLGGA